MPLRGRVSPVTFRRVGDKLMVNATQITMHFGKTRLRLRIASTDMLRREMAGNGHTGKYESQVFTTRGRGHGATWLESPLVIPLARWIAPDLSLAEWLGEAIGKLSVKRGKTIVRERPRVAAPRSALYGLSHAPGYGIGDETDSGTAEGGE